MYEYEDKSVQLVVPLTCIPVSEVHVRRTLVYHDRASPSLQAILQNIRETIQFLRSPFTPSVVELTVQ